ncbi:MAG: hypothetical protein EA397_16700 [Deltaproteobacteria bacterium]|nr:MAG: hypothetical protein EA397_16700 [Deltaproteobacteria bacterium]
MTSSDPAMLQEDSLETMHRAIRSYGIMTLVGAVGMLIASLGGAGLMLTTGPSLFGGLTILFALVAAILLFIHGGLAVFTAHKSAPVLRWSQRSPYLYLLFLPVVLLLQAALSLTLWGV